jgi:hypothetical protein
MEAHLGRGEPSGVVGVGMTGVKSGRQAPWERCLGMAQTHEE